MNNETRQILRTVGGALVTWGVIWFSVDLISSNKEIDPMKYRNLYAFAKMDICGDGTALLRKTLKNKGKVTYSDYKRITKFFAECDKKLAKKSILEGMKKNSATATPISKVHFNKIPNCRPPLVSRSFLYIPIVRTDAGNIRELVSVGLCKDNNNTLVVGIQ